MEMAQEGPDGEPVLPLFMSAEDAKDAIAQATRADQPMEPLQIQVQVLELARLDSDPGTRFPISDNERLTFQI